MFENEWRKLTHNVQSNHCILIARKSVLHFACVTLCYVGVWVSVCVGAGWWGCLGLGAGSRVCVEEAEGCSNKKQSKENRIRIDEKENLKMVVFVYVEIQTSVSSWRILRHILKKVVCL